jgi:hypothetical protein
VLVVLAGCGGDPKVSPSPTPSSPVTSPVSTTPTPPALPDAAKANTKAGAIAFVRHYIDVFNVAQESGDGSAFRDLSATDCSDCRAVLQGLERIYEAGGHIEGGALRVVAATADYNGAEDHWIVLARVTSGPQQVFATSTDTAPKKLQGGTRSMNLTLIRQRGNWMVATWSNA